MFRHLWTLLRVCQLCLLGEASWELSTSRGCSVEGQDPCQFDRRCRHSSLCVFRPLNYSNVSAIEFTVENQ